MDNLEQHEEHGSNYCLSCLRITDDVRDGICLSCATEGELRLARRTVVQHLKKGCKHVLTGQFEYARIDFTLALCRALRLGDYKFNGYFEQTYGPIIWVPAEINK